MAAPVMSYLLTSIFAKVNRQILLLAFDPVKNQTSLDTRIISEVIQARVLLDVNLLMGKKTKIQLLDNWLVKTGLSEFAVITGALYDSSFYFIPPEAREMRNISTIQGISSDYAYSLPVNGSSSGNANNIGNTVASLADAAVSSRTEYNYPIMPQATLQSQNLIRIFPVVYSDGLVLDCTLEYDSEFTNANQNVIYHLRNLSVCAVKTWIYNELVIQIDTAEIIGGMAIGAVKDIIQSYATADEEYHDLLMKVRGAMLMDPEMLTSFVSMML